MSDILVYNNWDKLEEIWLGDTYPAHFYDDFDPEVRDNFYKITEYTKTDLDVIQKKFEEFGVTVVRPNFKDKSNYLHPRANKLLKPPIAPRDHNAVIADTLIYNEGFGNVYTEMASKYKSHARPQDDFIVHGAGIVKLGRDIIFDFPSLTGRTKKEEYIDAVFEHYTLFLKFCENYIKDYRIHYGANGGHTDGCFMPLRPGLVLTTTYWKDYAITLPKDWQNIKLAHPTFSKRNNPVPRTNYKWGFPQFEDSRLIPVFNKYIEKFCSDWIGNYKETFFEVNLIMIDENNMVCLDKEDGSRDPLFEQFNKQGINVHVVPWRTRTFWDGGLHCITLDVRRKAVKKDYFPERGDNGIKTIMSRYLTTTDMTLFNNQYNQWLKTKGLR